MKYKCTGYQLVQEEGQPDRRVDCPEVADEEDLHVKTWLFHVKKPAPEDVIEHALCRGCVDRINEHRVEVMGKLPITFKSLMFYMGPARKRAERSQQDTKVVPSGSTKCSYCCTGYDHKDLVCQTIESLQERLNGDLPTMSQVNESAVCYQCARHHSKMLGVLVPISQVMSKVRLTDAKVKAS